MPALEILVIPCLHQLVEVAVHVLHADMQLPGQGVQEDVESGNQVRMTR